MAQQYHAQHLSRPMPAPAPDTRGPNRWRRNSRGPEAPGGSPADRAQDRRLAAAVRRAIDELPPEVKPVVVLFFAHQMSYKEIAAAVGCPVGTVMSRLYRGRRSLRESLRDQAPISGKNAGTG